MKKKASKKRCPKDNDKEHIGCKMYFCVQIFIIIFLSDVCQNAMFDGYTRTNGNFANKTLSKFWKLTYVSCATCQASKIGTKKKVKE